MLRLIPPALLSLAIFVAPSSAVAQATASTRDGVYTAAQAERGRITYAGMCKSCHVGNHTGATFEKLWKDHTLEELFTYTSVKMPKNNPGSMNPDEYADVVAYLLKLNALPAGAKELPADSASLAAVRIELPAKPAKGASKPPVKQVKKP